VTSDQRPATSFLNFGRDRVITETCHTNTCK